MKSSLLATWLTIAAAAAHAFGATLTVTTLADSGPGTLRDRLAASANGDRIEFGVFGTILLSTELTVSNSVVIAGPGVPFLQISGNQATRVFHITSGSPGINNLCICDGRVVGTNGAAGRNGESVMGGAILIATGASLGMSTVVISNNTVVGGRGGSPNQAGSSGNGGNALGGAIANLGQLTLVVASVSGNAASGGMGGPGETSPGAGGDGSGGGIYSESRANITLCTIHDNKALAGSGVGGSGRAAGGGIYSMATLAAFVSTVANNSASGSSSDMGGGLFTSGPLFLGDLTIVGNDADVGGGLNGAADLGNTILAGNTAGTGPDGNGNIMSSDYNLIQQTNGLTIAGATAHNLIGLDPLLTPLQDNGGYNVGFALLTMVPLPGSPVIDQGKSANSDARAFQRPFDTCIPNASGGNGSDIGSTEFLPARPRLSIRQAKNDVLLSWSTNDCGFVLQCITNVDAENWLDVASAPVINGDQFFVTNQAVGPQKFYRLAPP
jgi:hypothetical protein